MAEPDDTAVAEDDKPSIGFMDLSAELRNKIYELVLTVTEEIPIYKFRIGTRRREGNGRRQLEDPQLTLSLSVNLLATCKTIHSEARSILYGSNSFVLWSPGGRWCNGHTSWMVKIGDSVQYLRTVTLPSCPYQGYLAKEFENLKQAKSLESLTVRDWFNSGSRTAAGLAKTLLPLMAHLHQNRQGTDKKQALDILEVCRFSYYPRRRRTIGMMGMGGMGMGGMVESEDRRHAEAKAMLEEMLGVQLSFGNAN